MATAGSTQGLSNDPRLLSGAAAGLACAVATLWAVHGLPLGGLLLWLSPLPVFLAGLSFGAAASGIAAAMGAVALLLTTGLGGAGNFLVTSGLPAATMVLAALRGTGLAVGTLALPLPMALLGLWSAAAVFSSLILIGPQLEQGMTTVLGQALRDAGSELDAVTLGRLVRAGIAVGGAFLALPLLLCGILAQFLLSRRHLALRATPRWSLAHLPRWYLPVVALAAVLAWLLPGLPSLAALVALLGPVFLQGLASVHARLRGPVLIPFYLVLVLFSVPVVAVLIGLGLFEQFGRKPDQT